MIEHLSIQGNQIQGEGSIVPDVQTKLEPLQPTQNSALEIVKNGIELKKL
jgi:hypothetical protein